MSRRVPIPLALWVPLATCVTIGVPGVIALMTHHVVLFASLAPTSVMITQQPMLASTRPYNTILGHMIGLGSGFFAVWSSASMATAIESKAAQTRGVRIRVLKQLGLRAHGDS
ncbi:MAG: hypothetical protein HIU85_18055 [Proteobacteria bacterium]|nr:hypothetical protein [Pseudomonadota bacterium]